MKTESTVQQNLYFYSETNFGAYILHRPTGQEIVFLQGDDALAFEKELEKLAKIEFPIGCFENSDQLLSTIINQYDC